MEGVGIMSSIICEQDAKKIKFIRGCGRDFAEVVECVKGDKGKVVAITSPERAQAVNEKERPGFFDAIHKVL